MFPCTYHLLIQPQPPISVEHDGLQAEFRPLFSTILALIHTLSPRRLSRRWHLVFGLRPSRAVLASRPPRRPTLCRLPEFRLARRPQSRWVFASIFPVPCCLAGSIASVFRVSVVYAADRSHPRFRSFQASCLYARDRRPRSVPDRVHLRCRPVDRSAPPPFPPVAACTVPQFRRGIVQAVPRSRALCAPRRTVVDRRLRSMATRPDLPQRCSRTHHLARLRLRPTRHVVPTMMDG